MAKNLQNDDESRASRLSRLAGAGETPPKSWKSESRNSNWKDVLFCVLAAPFMLALLAGWIGMGVFASWFYGGGLIETALTGRVPTQLLQLVKFLVFGIDAVVFFVGLGFIWQNEPRGWRKVGAIIATVILFSGCYSITTWTHNGRGAVETSDTDIDVH